jgi:hypothetical protein
MKSRRYSLFALFVVLVLLIPVTDCLVKDPSLQFPLYIYMVGILVIVVIILSVLLSNFEGLRTVLSNKYLLCSIALICIILGTGMMYINGNYKDTFPFKMSLFNGSELRAEDYFIICNIPSGSPELEVDESFYCYSRLPEVSNTSEVYLLHTDLKKYFSSRVRLSYVQPFSFSEEDNSISFNNKVQFISPNRLDFYLQFVNTSGIHVFGFEIVDHNSTIKSEVKPFKVYASEEIAKRKDEKLYYLTFILSLASVTVFSVMNNIKNLLKP